MDCDGSEFVLITSDMYWLATLIGKNLCGLLSSDFDYFVSLAPFIFSKNILAFLLDQMRDTLDGISKSVTEAKCPSIVGQRHGDNLLLRVDLDPTDQTDGATRMGHIIPMGEGEG